MKTKRKKLLIVDDTEIDRITLKSILYDDFDVLEAASGNDACEYIAALGDQLDAILLDISMPDVDGFGVLQFIEAKHLEQIPVFLVTAEPTVDNVQRAMRHNIAEFIGKPFQREEVLRRLRARLGVSLEPDLKNEELEATWAYVADLEGVYRAYLTNHGWNDVRSRIVSDLVRIMLKSYNHSQRENRLSDVGVELAARAAYFCDIGEMLMPCQWFQPMTGDPRLQELRRSHTALGASLIRLNRDKNCAYFVELCADMCLHHHERFDGRGYPDKLREHDNPVCNQLCRLADEFEQVRGGAYDKNGQTVSQVIQQITESGGMVSPGLYSLLKSCESKINNYFKKIYQGV